MCGRISKIFVSGNLCVIGAIVIASLSGCARNEAELQSSVQDVFDTTFIPAKILVRQFDNGFDAVGVHNQPVEPLFTSSESGDSLQVTPVATE
ncbi:MAG: hypothetical protein AB1454_03185 [Candidatus Auribacterota bacterium]|jgi:hypothetical protein|uniref:Uncharacterized protein n=1 Tax=Candidatus Auribacter fodinae TaxID=2093366 RepID=A0A3A4R270_9BACT|nr:MAG: hypothetical protein C4541_06960 [Candidatus Auribacter fodinae]